LPFVYEGTCTDTCPIGYGAINYVCQECESPCKTCVDSTTQCLTCDGTDGKKWAFGYQCYTECPGGTTPNYEDFTCEGCLTGCSLCEKQNQKVCIKCESGLYLFEGNCTASCPSGYSVNLQKTACVKGSILDLPIVYFPFLICALVGVAISLGGYFKDPRSLIITNIIALWGPIEFVAYLF